MISSIPIRKLAASCAAAGLASASLAAEPLFDPDSGPLGGLFGWPTSDEGSRLSAEGSRAWSLHARISSHATAETSGGESLVLDGETTRLWLDYRRGMSQRFELGVRIPWVWHESGSLDALIDDWHDFFGLPDGNRLAWPRDRLLFEYRAPGGDLLRLDRNRNGPGDLRLYGGWQLRASPGGSLALRFGVKLPTGDSERLLGSGATDLSIGLAGDGSRLLRLPKLSGFYRISALRLGTPDLVIGGSRRFAGQLSAGLAYDLTPGFSLSAQSTVRSAAFDAAVAPLGDWAMSLTVGGRFRLPGGWRLALGFTEDIRVESTPDITFLLSVAASSRPTSPRTNPP